MLLDWLSREGVIVLSWWALVTMAGVAVLPLCLRVLGGLPDRGYTLARAAGLLVVGFVFWLLASLGFLRNTTDSMALAWLIVLIAGLAIYFGAGKERIDLRAWWKDNNRVVIVGEIVFFVLLLGWSIFRAYQNNLSGTEKPMELAFLSATMRSQTFPPADPWLSGYAISYYYFGYVIMAMLSMLSGVASTVGFNMTDALLFALTGLTVFGVVYNLVRSREKSTIVRRAALLVGLLGMVLVILLSNFEMIFVEIPWETHTASADYLQMWNLNGRQTPRPGDDNTDPVHWEYWWWWHGARVISDRNLDGVHTEVIDEFPGFSFLLSDNHPHVLSLPFAALALGLALNTLLTRRKPNRYEIVFYSIVFGGLIFLNTWDGPIYLIVLVAAEALRRLMHSGRLRGQDWRELGLLGGTLLVLAVVLYLPFIAAFRSQAAGISPNLLNPTLPGQFFLMFGPFILLIAPFLALEAWRAGRRMNWRIGLQIGALGLLGLIALMLLLAVVGYVIPSVRDQVNSFAESNGGWGTVVAATFAKRIAYLPTALLLFIGLILIAGRLFPRRDPDADDDKPAPAVTYLPSTGFVLLLIAAALVLTLVPEFVYLRDSFSARMNTVFKFYYQAWLMCGIGGAYGVYSVFAGARQPSPLARAVYAGLTVVVLIAGLIYPIMGIQARMFVETDRVYSVAPEPPTLNGGGTVSNDDDYQAALCLGNLVKGESAVIASAVGPSYNWPAGAISTYTGIPTVFNWPYHELQWRGDTYNLATKGREQDIDHMYRDPTWSGAEPIIARYGINYVVYGSKEHTTYDRAEDLGSPEPAERGEVSRQSGCRLRIGRDAHLPRAGARADSGTGAVRNGHAARNPNAGNVGSERPAWRVVIGAEWIAYVALVALALVLRFAELDSTPMMPFETHNALAAWRVIMPNAPGDPLIPTSSILFVLQSLSFTLFGGSEVAARLMTVLGGVALMLTPILFRPLLGRARTLLVSVLLAFSPVLLIASRTSSPDVWALLFAVLSLWGLWQAGRTQQRFYAGFAVVLFAGLIFLSGSGGFALALILAVAGAITIFWRRRRALIDGEDEDAPLSLAFTGIRGSLELALPAAALIVLVVSTGFMIYPAGLSAVAQGIGGAIQAVVQPKGAGGYALLVSLYYEPALWVLAIVGFALRRERRTTLDVFLAAWLALGVLVSLFFADGSPDHALWFAVPLAALAVNALMWALSQDDRLAALVVPRWARWVIAVSAIGVLAVFTLSFQSMARSLLAAPQGSLTLFSPQPDSIVLLLVSIMFLVIGFFLFASLWGGRTSWQGVLLGLAIFGMVTSLGSGWNAAAFDSQSAVEFWHMQATNDNTALLRETLFDVADRVSGGFPAVPITVVAPQDGVVAWLLRDFSNTKFITDINDAADAEVVIVPETLELPQSGAAYVGQDFVITRSWDISSMSLLDIPAWWTQRQARNTWTTAYAVNLWLRQDVYQGTVDQGAG